MSDSKRRSELGDANIQELTEEGERALRKEKHKRDRSYDAQRVKATYDLPEGLRDTIRETAESENVAAYQLVQLFLEYCLDIYDQEGLETFGVKKKRREVTYDLVKE